MSEQAQKRTLLNNQESVWDYPRPPRVEPVAQTIRVIFNGITLAETTRAMRVLETSHPPVYYLPSESVRTRYLLPTMRSTTCEYKGVASYWAIKIDDRLSLNAAWSYEAPLAGFESIRGHLAFYASRVDACYVGDERVIPQQSEFYGGWITRNIIGPFKGPPGTQGW